MRGKVALGTGSIVLLASATGCPGHSNVASPGSRIVVVRTFRGLPSVDLPVHRGERVPAAVRLGSTRIALTFWGSGSCPAVPTGANWTGSTTLDVTVSSHGGACTSDEAATTSVLSVAPKRLPSASITLHFLGGVSQVPASAVV